MEHQDWNTVVLKRNLTENEQKAKYGSESKARAGHSGEGAAKRKIDQETETFHHNKIPKDKRLEIIKLRTEKKLTQKQLAQKVNLPFTEINAMESGQALYDAKKVQTVLVSLRSRTY